METELWRPVRGFEGYYEVSDQGRVKRVAGGPGTRVGTILKPSTGKTGYHHVMLTKNGKPQKHFVHRIMLHAFKRPMRADQTDTRHLNGIPNDNRLCNLEFGTKTENQADRAIHGTTLYGARNPCAKLTEIQVQEIRTRCITEKITHRELARQYGVSRSLISRIVSREIWNHLNHGEPLPCTKLSSRC